MLMIPIFLNGPQVDVVPSQSLIILSTIFVFSLAISIIWSVFFLLISLIALVAFLVTRKEVYKKRFFSRVKKFLLGVGLVLTLEFLWTAINLAVGNSISI